MYFHNDCNVDVKRNVISIDDTNLISSIYEEYVNAL